MTATERVEAVNAARHTLIQAATGLVVIGGVVFTAQGLWYTAQSLDASRQAQRVAEQSQITDRYTKAVEQLGSTKLDVRLGGMYALERLAQDSPRDHQTVYDVLAAFVREHDLEPNLTGKDLPLPPATDIQAALTIISRQDGTPVHMPDLAGIRTPLTNLRGARLVSANLTGGDLSFARLTLADLRGARLVSVNLTGADLSFARLTLADLGDARLVSANLSHMDLSHTDLTSANLTDADLTGANLTGANLINADLTGANLTAIRGVTESEIRTVAKIDKTTIF
ncbi:pentapeptide repeat-containing protein [Nonomuraea ceibae]|uniref:pentapeptide repeat-containing protein n=1 Tax=Nonomuraea ceibae TaxID=1935170 RepID=UPI001C5D7A7B|nr:pentapeptide repeat-containing protein [Nonomuraea ceibae]